MFCLVFWPVKSSHVLSVVLCRIQAANLTSLPLPLKEEGILQQRVSIWQWIWIPSYQAIPQVGGRGLLVGGVGVGVTRVACVDVGVRERVCVSVSVWVWVGVRVSVGVGALGLLGTSGRALVC
jgi:hypothetical protein